MKRAGAALRIQRNARQQMSGYAMLRGLEEASAKLVFFDPQYRSVLDKLRFGNEGQAKQRHRAALPQMSDHDIAMFIEQIERVLKPSGHLMMWVDKFAIGTARHLWYMRYAQRLRIVDLLCWNAMRFGMGRRTRGSSEYLVVVQKVPVRAKGLWVDRAIRDCWTEQADRDRHPHAKPYVLTERLIRAVTKQGDLVVDPCAGSYTVLDACIASRREFIGCDLVGGK